MSDLTPSQRAAVEHFEGPLLVLAGPGSGKTRVITRRIARLVERGIDPARILAITFTNKAAGEMAERVSALLPGEQVAVSTFHKFCARLLRRRAESVGLRQNYTIYDTGDQAALMRAVLSELDFDAAQYPPGKLLHRIGRLKNEMVTAEDFARGAEQRAGDHVEAVLAKAYPAYQQALLDANAVDFDDLLLHVVKLLHENDDLRADLDERHKFVLVDEYQDTNLAQYAIVRALNVNHRNLCVTGDPDQSIYGWRGARIENILRFEQDYAGAKTVRLEENFRSTTAVLRIADELIARNVQRKRKVLKTDNPEGDPPRRATFRDAKHEADGIAAEIAQRVAAGDRRLDDYAIFYRVNSLSRQLEIALTRHRVPYQIAAGVSFYDRTEVKDLLAYLRLLHNPSDVVAFKRIVNKPKRAIGETSQRRLLEFAAEHGLTSLEAAARAKEVPKLPKPAANALKKFAGLFDALTAHVAGSVEALLTKIVNETRYNADLIDSSDEDDLQRMSNVDELVVSAAQYDKAAGRDGSLEGFLETVSLTAEVDSVDESAGRVTLMTLHAAKGLEFPCVYVVGVEHGLLPHDRSLNANDPRELEEERRLLFVGVTRARQELTLTHVNARETRGRTLPAIVSEFLFEMPSLDHADFAGGGRGYRIEDGHPDHDDDFSQLDPEELAARTGRVAAAVSRLNRGDVDADEPAPKVRLVPANLKTLKGLKLVTGASLLSGDASAADLPTGFGVGQKVRHPSYGTGVVVSADGFARNRRLTVEFDDDRSRKTFVAAKCPLQPVGAR